MIRALFLPDSLFTQEVIGIEIGKYHVSACQVSKKNESTKLKKIVSIAIEANNETSYDEQVVIALKQLLTHASGNQIRVTISNNQIFFKEITVPFLDYQKIKMILGYEIESALPFPLSEAIFDFIITKQDKLKSESTVLVAIAQKSQVNYITDLIKQTNTKIKLGAITADLFGMYGVYDLWSTNAPQNQTDVLLDLGKNSITITYLSHGKPLLVRNLPYGINGMVSKIMHASNKTHQDVVEKLFRIGLDQAENPEAASVFNKLGEDLVFTINSFKLQLPAELRISKLLVCQSAIEIKNITNYFSNQTTLDCILFEPNKIGLHKTLSLTPGLSIQPSNLPCLAAAITVPDNASFNLLSQNEVNQTLLRYQIITTIIITITIFGVIYGIGFVKNNALNKTLVQYKQQAIKELKRAFPEIDDSNLVSAINDAESNVNREKKLWFSFSNQTRYSNLQYLQALSSALDVKKLNLDLKKLIIKDNSMSLEGSVERNEDIFPFEQALTSIPIFKSVTTPQSTSFTIQITLKQSDQDGV